MSQVAKAASPAYKRPYRMVVGRNRLDDLIDGHAAMNVALQGAKTIYYCEGNAGLDTNTGVGGWENAFKTLAVAAAASHADIAADKYGWAARNVILCRGDSFDEDLVLLPQKTDFIGLGSYNHNQRPGLIGNHVPITNSNFGCRFYNFFFIANAAGGDIWTLNATAHGMGFYGCHFSAYSTTAATAAIVSTAAAFIEIDNCKFTGRFSDAVVEFGNGDTRGLRFTNNWVEGANVGIHLNSSVEDGVGGEKAHILIADNKMHCATYCIHDEASVARIIGNRCLSDADTGTSGAGVITGDQDFMLDNLISGSDINNTMIPPYGTVG